MSFSERLKWAREQAGLSQTQAARLLNGSRSNIWRWETGNPEMSADTLRRVAEIYDVSTDWLLTGKGGLSDDELELMSIQAARTNIAAEDFDKLISLLQSLRQVVESRDTEVTHD
jgi:transcriptional regulator with XRE-family HTH domain